MGVCLGRRPALNSQLLAYGFLVAMQGRPVPPKPEPYIWFRVTIVGPAEVTE